ncbi:MAG: type II toxin-antitoxin system RelE/ParE family toxin [Candidatus Sericytochromatia bacterium]|nr:type II toxin-antitoxin system RelE/ParE family toxin [Candidatus Sericytochromatia bacterium]
MLKNFRSKDLEKFYITGKSKNIPSELQKRLLNKIEILDNTVNIEDLQIPLSNNLEKLLGDLNNYYSIRVNKQFRLIFRFENENSYDVDFIDYH